MIKMMHAMYRVSSSSSPLFFKTLYNKANEPSPRSARSSENSRSSRRKRKTFPPWYRLLLVVGERSGTTRSTANGTRQTRSSALSG